MCKNTNLLHPSQLLKNTRLQQFTNISDVVGLGLEANKLFRVHNRHFLKYVADSCYSTTECAAKCFIALTGAMSHIHNIAEKCIGVNGFRGPRSRGEGLART